MPRFVATLALVSLASAILALSACMRTSVPCASGEVPTLRIAIANPRVQLGALHNTFSIETYTQMALVAMDTYGQIHPGLASAWETPDRKTWTFILRPHLTSHTGAAITAASLRQTLLDDIADPMHFIVFWKDLQSIEAPAPDRLVFHFARPVSMPDIRIYASSLSRVATFVFNLKSPWLHDVRVRQAINLAIDRDEVERYVYGALPERTRRTKPVMGPFSPDYWAADGITSPWHTDLAAARVTGGGTLYPFLAWRSGTRAAGFTRDNDYAGADAAFDHLRYAPTPDAERAAFRAVIDALYRDPPAASLVPIRYIRAVRKTWRVPDDEPDIRQSIKRWTFDPRCDAS